MRLSMIACVDAETWGIGNEGKLLFHIPDDMALFSIMTWGQTVIMGRNTFESLPNRRPLSDRLNIVISTTMEPADDVVVANSIDDMITIIRSGAREFLDDNIFVIGGESIYKGFLPYCDRAYITKVQSKHSPVLHDRVCPNLDHDPDWELMKTSNVLLTPIPHMFTIYERIANHEPI